MMAIINKAPPELNKTNWSNEFCSFVTKCLQKTPADRETATNLLLKDKFIAKAMSIEYLVDHFLSDMTPITQNPD